jgi:hypothetical protein
MSGFLAWITGASCGHRLTATADGWQPCIHMIAPSASGSAAARARWGPAALTTRACAPMGLGTGNSAAGRPPCL